MDIDLKAYLFIKSVEEINKKDNFIPYYKFITVTKMPNYRPKYGYKSRLIRSYNQ